MKHLDWRHTCHNKALDYWKRRSPRERQALRLMAWTLASALIFQAIWGMFTVRKRLLHQVPQLAEQAEKMAGLRETWQTLEARQAQHPMPRPEIVRREVESSLPALGQKVQANWSSEGELTLRGEVSIEAWLHWLGSTQTLGYVVHFVRLNAPSNGSLIHLEARLRPSSP